MLDPGRYVAEAIYFIQYTLAQLLWTIDRALLSIAVIAESINNWLTANTVYFVELIVNALSAPLGGMLILALTALGSWYLINNLVATERWVDPSRLITYGTLSLLFFATPVAFLNNLEALRDGLGAAIDPSLIRDAAGDIFEPTASGSDDGFDAAVADTNSDGVIASFDLVSAFVLMTNMAELDSNEFPAEFEATYFPYGDPSTINLADEADREEAKRLASQGVQRLLFALIAVPTAIAEHFLRLALTTVAMFLYAGAPFAMLFSFFVFTQAYLTAYLRQFLRLLIETFFSVMIIIIAIVLLLSAAEKGFGFYIGASLITFILLLWRIQSALKLAAAALDLFGGGLLSGGAGGSQIVRSAAAVSGVMVTGGASLAIGAAAMTAAQALRTDAQSNGRLLASDPAKIEARSSQLKTIAGYGLGRSRPLRQVIEGTHEVRTLTRSLRDGSTQPQQPDTLDYLRAGASMSGFGSSPWLAMRLSPSLRTAYDEIGGSVGYSGHPLAVDRDGDGAPVSAPAGVRPATAPSHAAAGGNGLGEHLVNLERALAALTAALRNGTAANSAGHQTTGFDRRLPTMPSAAGDGEPLTWVGPLPGAAQGADVERPPAAPPASATESRDDTQVAAPSAASAAADGSGVPTTDPAPPTPINDANGDDTRAAAPPAVRATADGADIPRPDPTSPASVISTDPDSAQRAAMPAVGATALDAGAHALERGRLQLARTTPQRRDAIRQTLQQLDTGDRFQQQSAQRTLTTVSGGQNAAQIVAAVREWSAATVDDAVDAIAAVVAGYQERGVAAERILQAFQSGEAFAAVQGVSDSPLPAEQLAAVADMLLVPQRQLTRADLLGVIAETAGDPAADEKQVLAAVGAAVDFGGQTGVVRGVLAQAQTHALTPRTLAEIGDQIEAGLRHTAVANLARQGLDPAAARELVADIAALPAVIRLPQSTAIKGDAHAP